MESEAVFPHFNYESEKLSEKLKIFKFRLTFQKHLVLIRRHFDKNLFEVGKLILKCNYKYYKKSFLWELNDSLNWLKYEEIQHSTLKASLDG